MSEDLESRLAELEARVGADIEAIRKVIGAIAGGLPPAERHGVEQNLSAWANASAASLDKVALTKLLSAVKRGGR